MDIVDTENVANAESVVRAASNGAWAAIAAAVSAASVLADVTAAPTAWAATR
jgi:hypothetical protein